ncbi:MAG: hypothetical protein IJZ75_02620 [Clostridia bacterium]|nr:hypothetical protein [Clostridia bacterium]
MNLKSLATLTILGISLLCLTAFAARFFKISSQNDIEDKYTYTLKSYRNCVALYENQEIVEIYDEIVLSNLPPSDRNNFDKGIVFESKTDAHIALEDYDS